MGDVLQWPLRPRTERVPARPEVVRSPQRPAADPLWREVVGQVLRELRQHRQETLAHVATRAGISVPYLSEIERGRKEPSSEVLAAVSGALDLRLVDLTAAVLRRLTPLDLTAGAPRVPSTRPQGPVALAA